VDYDLKVMQPGQSLSQVFGRVLTAFEPILLHENPDLVLVQGDTTTAVAGAQAAFYQQIPIGHVEAGLRTHEPYSPFPEEMNRRLISQLATLHFAPTEGNRQNLLAEGVSSQSIFVTGNPVVDALQQVQQRLRLSPEMVKLLQETNSLKRLVLTTHRRESFGPVLENNLRVLRDFVEHHEDVGLFFPVHPNPVVQETVRALLANRPRIYLLPPLDYQDFLGLVLGAWLLVSDSGGLQEEAPTLGKPLLVLRDETERPEALQAGVARLATNNAVHLGALLEEVYNGDVWTRRAAEIVNPFGQGDAGNRIAAAMGHFLRNSQGRCSTPAPGTYRVSMAGDSQETSSPAEMGVTIP
jgi:UDP-N-acetylglucosamine 2-epimerase (non-hydrolysing)